VLLGGLPNHTTARVWQVADGAGRVVPLAREAAGDPATLYLAGITCGVSSVTRFPALGVSIGLSPDALYADAIVFASRVATSRAQSAGGLVLVTQPVRIGPTGWVTRRAFDIRIDAPAAGERDAIFRYDDRHGSWSFVGGARDPAGLSARSGRPGVFAVMTDTTPPWLGAPQLAWPASYATGNTYPEIRVPVDDRGAGIDDARTSVTVGGVKRYARWDFARKKIIVALPGESIIGAQPVQVTVFDKVGNQSVVDATVNFESR
jgi:hypothetical protein